MVTDGTMIDITNKVNDDAWEHFLQHCSSATIYHTPGWKSVLQETFNYKPKYLFAIDDTGNVIGLLPLFHIKSKITGDRLCSLPFSYTCGAIGNEKCISRLMEGAIDMHHQLKTGYIEVRDARSIGGFQVTNSFSTYILTLSQAVKDVWSKLDRGSVRWAINRSRKNGVNVIKADDMGSLKEYYELNCMTKKNLGVPAHPWKFFVNLNKYLKSNLTLYMAMKDKETIGGGIFEYYKDHVLYGYGAAHPDFLKQYPYNAFIWESIKDACKDGYRIFDFGRVHYDNKGLVEFKKRWGTHEEKLYYSYYAGRRMSPSRRKTRYGIVKHFIRSTPMSLYKNASEIAFKNFG